MEKRVIIAVVLCIAVLMLWSKLFPPPRPPAPAQQPPVTSSSSSAGAGNDMRPAGGAAAAATAAGSPANRPAREVVMTTPDVRFVFSSAGGTLLHAELLAAKFRDRPGDASTGHELVRTLEPKDAPLATSFPNSAFALPAAGAWEVSQPSADTVVFSADVGGVHIEKRYRADTTRYRLHLDVSVVNRSDRPADHHLAMTVSGRQDPDKRGGGFFSGPASNPASILCHVDGKTEREATDKLAKGGFDKTGAVRWIAADEKFFLLAVVPYPESPARERTCAAHAIAGDGGQGTLLFSERTLPPGAETHYAFAIFAGPKVRDDLEAVAPGGESVQLDQAIDIGSWMSMLSRPILALLKLFQRFAHNWGLAIVLLTLFIKLVTFLPTQKSLLSAKKMQRLAPKMNAIRKKYENDRQRQSIETMNLYKQHGVSPFGGCLPSLIQMPIWIALYSTLNYSVELYRAPFVAHIHDLTAKDPYYITPLVMGAVMFLQMKMSPTGADTQQQAMMSVMMPVMFTAFSLFLPSGLALYMLTSYLIGIAQQLYVNHLDRKGAIA